MNAKTVLIIEDDPFSINILKDILACEGFTIVIAKTVQEAFKLLDSLIHIDLVLLNLTLPDGLGLSLIKPLRKKFSNLKIILTSVNEEAHIPLLAVQSIDHFAAKPFSPQCLIKKIQALFKAS